jgi:hypothetical protein
MTRKWQVTQDQFILFYIESDTGYQATLYYQYDTPRVVALQGFYSPTTEGVQLQVNDYLSQMSQALDLLKDACNCS